MKQTALTNAIALGQLFKLLAPFGRESKSFNKRIGRLRSALDECVVAAVSDPAKGEWAEAQIAAMVASLRDVMKAHLHIPELLSQARGAASASYRVLRSGKGVRHSAAENLLLDGVDAAATPRLVATATQVDRKRVLHAFSSAVNNSNWLSVLMGLGMAIGDAGSASASLRVRFGSHPGQMGLEATLLALCPGYKDAPVRRARSKKTVPAVGLYSLQVVLSVDALLANPDIAELAQPGMDGSKKDNLTALFETATKPVVVPDGYTPEATAQRVVDELMTGLRDRQKVLDAARKKQQEAAESAAQDSALQMLKSLKPAMLKVLKRNPDLLQKA